MAKTPDGRDLFVLLSKRLILRPAIPLNDLTLVLGLYPAKGLVASNNHRIELQWSLLPLSLFSVSLVLVMFVGAFTQLYVELKEHDCVGHIAGTAGACIFYLFGVLDMLFLLLSIPLFPKVLRSWTEVERKQVR